MGGGSARLWRVAVCALALALGSGSARAAVAVDASSSTSGDAASFTWSHTCSGTQRLLVVGVSSRDPVSSVTYNGQGLTLLRRDTNGGWAITELWYLVAPPTGTHNVVVTMSAGEDTVCGAISFTGASTATPFGTATGATGRSTTASVAVNSAAGEIVVDTICFRGADGNPTVGAGQTQRWQAQSGPNNFGDVEGGASTEAGAASVTMSWNFAVTDRWAITSVSVKPATPGHFQESYRWAHSDESALQAENTAYTSATNQQLHLRVGIRSQESSWGTHRLGLQYANNPSFTGAAMLPSGAWWNDADHADGDAVSGTKLLSGSPSDGEYHESNVTSSETKAADVLYEEDFTIMPTATGTWYLRVVEVDSGGNFVSTLDGYSQTIQLDVVNAQAKQTGFAWAPDAAVAPSALSWQTEDTELIAQSGNIYVIAVQVALDNNITNGDFYLQYQEDYDTGSPGAWTNVTTGGVWTTTTAHQCTITNGTVTQTAWYSQSGHAGYTVATGEFCNDNNGLRDSYTSGNYVELWYAITASAAARGHSYQFRVVAAGSSWNPRTFAIARVPAREQVSYRWLESNEGPAAAENDFYETVENVKLHLRVGVRSGQEDWNGKYLALQVDDNTGFTSPTLLTTGSATFKTWDDPNHTGGDAVSGAKMLSGSPSDGKYHESNVTSSQNFTGDVLYEVDFTVQVNYTPIYDNPDTWYFRVVEVTSAGVLVGPLDAYSQTIRLDVELSTNRQSAYNWAPDAASLSWGTANQPLNFSTGQKYILAIQYERVYSGASGTWDWQLQYQEDPDGTPGDWTDVTYTSTYWQMTNNTETYNGHNNNGVVTTGQFVCGSGAGTAANGEYSNDDNGVAYAWTGSTYSEFWYAVEAQAAAANKTFAFRVIRGGNTRALEFAVLARAVYDSKQQTAYRWADDGEGALAAENTSTTVATNQDLHLRVGIKPQGAAWSTHYLALQWDDNASFTSPTLVTTASATVRMYDDGDRTDGDAVSGSKLLSGSPSDGEYHESNVTSAETKTADLVYEEDFTVRCTTAGTYYLRVVEVNAAGALVGTLDDYQQTIQVEAVDPADDQTAYNWAPDAAVLGENLVWGGENTALNFTTSNTYILAVQVKNTSASDSDYDWVIQYQKDPDGTPGPWTSVTTGSTDWQIDSTPAFVDIANEGTVEAANHFSMSSPGGTAVNGEFSSDSNGATHVLSGNPVYAEYWFAVTPQASAAGFKYRFRITNSGSTYGISYTTYAITSQSSQEQVSYRWADASDAAMGSKNASISAATGAQLHLRVGVRSNNGAWNGHRLGLEFADNPSFTGASVMVEGAGNLRMWDDADHADATAVTGTKLLEPPAASYGYWHEKDDAQASESFAADTIYEEDFAVQASVNGTYYIRIIEVNAAGAKVGNLDTYSQTIQLTVASPADAQSGYEWGLDNGAAPTWQGDDTNFHFTPGTKYILSIQIDHQSGSTSDYDWQIQYQESPFVYTPGSWTTITGATSKWKTISPTNVSKTNEGAVATGEFGQAGVVGGTAVAGEFSDDSSGAQYAINNNNDYTELWFCIQPDSNAAGKQYRFRVTDGGSPSGITYSIYAFAYNVHIWDGSSSGAWGTTANWAPEILPATSQDVQVPSSALYANAPNVTVATNNLDALTVDSGGTLGVGASGNLQVAGTVTLNGGINMTGGQATLSSGITVPAGKSVTVGSTAILILGANSTLNGNLTVAANGTLRMANGTSFTGNTGSTFTVSGTSQQAGGYATVEAISGTYNMGLAGNVDVTYARFYDLGAAGLTLSANATTTIFENVVFYDSSSMYLHVTGAAWDGYEFVGLGFADAGGTNTVEIDMGGGTTVTLTGYASGAGWLSGEGSDADTSGDVLWGPSAAEGLEARVRRTGRAALVTWSAASERGTAGYRVLRRKVERCGGLIEEEATGKTPRGARFEKFTGAWREVARTAVGVPGGEPGQRRYRHRDKPPPGTHEYLIEEVEGSGRPGRRARVEEAKR